MECVAKGQCRKALQGTVAASLTGAIALEVGACQRSTEPSAEARRPQQAGQPMNSYAVAGHVAAARLNLLAGDSKATQNHVEGVAHDFSRSIRLPDVARPIDHEAARAATRNIAGVRSAIWLDRSNLAVMVDGAEHRSMTMIDQVCLALEPLADTLAVVVNVQDVTVKNADGATTLSRYCQLPEGRRALLQAKREVDVVAPELRKTLKELHR